MNMWIPVEHVACCGNRKNRSGHTPVRNGDFKILADCLPGATAKLGEQLAIIQEKNAKHFRNRKNHVPVGTIRQNLLAKKLTKQNGSFGRARWKKSSSFTRERQQILVFTMGTTDPRKTIFQHSAIQVLAHYIGYHRTPLAVFLFEPQIVLSHKAIKVMKQYRIERSLLRVSSWKKPL